MKSTPVAELREEILGAIGRGWTHKDTENKIMDATLAVAISGEVLEVIKSRDEELIAQLEKMKIAISKEKDTFGALDLDKYLGPVHNKALDDVIALIRKRL